MRWDNWNYKQPPAHSECLLTAILEARGFVTPLEQTALLSRGLSRLHDPYKLAGMDKAVQRIRRAIDAGEHVAIYGDYDADGLTATALFSDFLRTQGLTCETYIPNRLTEGYGLHTAALDQLAALGVTLIITVDCGVSANAEVAYAAELGVDVVITDHHRAEGALPDAAAVVDPALPHCTYPEKELAGVGVAFKCVCAIAGAEHTKELLMRYTDLIALGTVADMVSLAGENRTLAAHGLAAICSSDALRPGIAALLQKARLRREQFDASGISFGLAPRLNAAGRMGQADVALNLLSTQDATHAAMLADTLENLNQTRREIAARMFSEAMAQLEQSGYRAGPIILAGEGWHTGVVGNVASQLNERFCVPVILLCIEGGSANGSGRSVPDFDLFCAIGATALHLAAFGGHEQAVGLTLDMENFSAWKIAFLNYYKANAPEHTTKSLEADLAVPNPNLLTLPQIELLQELEPCGNGNPAPLLVLEDARITRLFPIGGGKHVKLQIQKWGQSYDAVFFGVTMGELTAAGIKTGTAIDTAYTPQINEFRGNRTVQLLVRDLRVRE